MYKPLFQCLLKDTELLQVTMKQFEFSTEIGQFCTGSAESERTGTNQSSELLSSMQMES